MSFKFFREDDITFRLEPMQILTLAGPRQHTNNEYCFQFDDEEPFVFGMGNESLNITISPTHDGSVQFQNNGRTFKIFARERQ